MNVPVWLWFATIAGILVLLAADLFIVAICVFLLGSALCGAAQGMTPLVIFRAVQGCGAGGLIPLALPMVAAACVATFIAAITPVLLPA